MMLERPVLQGEAVRLEPLTRAHAEGLWMAADPAVFTYLTLYPADRSLDAFTHFVDQTLAMPGWSPFAIIDREKNRAIGMTSYLDIRLAHRGLEIGATWLSPECQGTVVNPEAKLLLLGYAFDTLGMTRVQLKTDGRNARSQRAIAKLGAVREGVLRRHMILPDGYVRDTVMFSIIESEWPGVKAGLEARIKNV